MGLQKEEGIIRSRGRKLNNEQERFEILRRLNCFDALVPACCNNVVVGGNADVSAGGEAGQGKTGQDRGSILRWCSSDAAAAAPNLDEPRAMEWKLTAAGGHLQVKSGRGGAGRG